MWFTLAILVVGLLLFAILNVGRILKSYELLASWNCSFIELALTFGNSEGFLSLMYHFLVQIKNILPPIHNKCRGFSLNELNPRQLMWIGGSNIFSSTMLMIGLSLLKLNRSNRLRKWFCKIIELIISLSGWKFYYPPDIWSIMCWSWQLG
jgi:hypothetical protein